jgi:hypothetical protein
MHTSLNRALACSSPTEIAGRAANAPPRRLPPESKPGSSEARSIVHHNLSHTGRFAWSIAPASDITLALGGACGAFRRQSPPCSPRLTDRANARRERESLRGQDRIRRARGSRAWAAAKVDSSAPPPPGARAHFDGSAHARVRPRHLKPARPRCSIRPPSAALRKRPHE